MNKLIFAVVALLCIQTFAVGHIFDTVLNLPGTLGNLPIVGPVVGPVTTVVTETACLAVRAEFKIKIASVVIAVNALVKLAGPLIHGIRHSILPPLLRAADIVRAVKIRPLNNAISAVIPVLAPLRPVITTVSNQLTPVITAVEGINTALNLLDILKLPCVRGLVKGNCASIVNAAGCLVKDIKLSIKELADKLRNLQKTLKYLARDLQNLAKNGFSFDKTKTVFDSAIGHIGVEVDDIYDLINDISTRLNEVAIQA